MKKMIRRVVALALCALMLTSLSAPFSAVAGREPPALLAAGSDGALSATDADPALATATDPLPPPCVLTGEHEAEVFEPAGDGTHTAVCTVCGERFIAVCEYEDEVTLPTATEAGFTTHTCTVCGYTCRDQETVPENERQESALPGDMNRDGKIGSDDARTLLRVSVSLETLKDELLPYGDMDGDGAILPADARLALRCSVSLEPTPDRHEYGVAVTEAASCTETGMMTFSCAYCGKEGEMKIPAKGHRYEITHTTAPTCTVDGTRFERCAVCGEAHSVTLRAAGHAYEQTAYVAATCTAAGSETLTCKICKDVQTKALPALGHDWVEAVPGKAKHCARCGEVVAGWTEIDGVSYYFNADGTPMTGKHFMNGLLFTFSATGASETGRTGRKPKVAVIGDSIVASIANYNVATDFDMYGKVSLHVDTIDSKYISGSSRTVLREVEGRGYDVVILMIGVNDLTYDNTWWGNRYRTVLRQLKELAPGAIIYASAILPINDSKTSADEKMWMVNAKNQVIRSAAEAEGVRYLGTPPGLLNANGQLPYDAASDGVHFGPTYCRIWYEWTKEQLK